MSLRPNPTGAVTDQQTRTALVPLVERRTVYEDLFSD